MSEKSCRSVVCPKCHVKTFKLYVEREGPDMDPWRVLRKYCCESCGFAQGTAEVLERDEARLRVDEEWQQKIVRELAALTCPPKRS